MGAFSKGKFMEKEIVTIYTDGISAALICIL